MKNFNWDTLVAIHCDTKAKADDFLTQADKHGFNLNGGGCVLGLGRYYYGVYGKETCYDIVASEKIIMFASLSYYKNEGYKIIEWEIDNMKEFTEKDLKVGMLVETKCGRRAIVMPERDYLVASYADGYIEDIDFTNDSFSIVKVWSESSNLNFTDNHRTLLWERKEEEMTLEAVCKELGRNIKIIK